MKKIALNICLLVTCCMQVTIAQTKSYSMQNAHAHNDYLHEKPFFEAYSLNYGMIEADIFIQNGNLMVAHEKKSIKPENTLTALYINPIIAKIKENHGRAYLGDNKLILLIDIKEEGDQVLKLLTNQLKPNRHLFDLKHNPNAVQIVISGDMPKSEDFKNYDSIFQFDGRPKNIYSSKSFKRIGLLSTSIMDFVKWNKTGVYSEVETIKLRNFVDSVHHSGKRVRFWATPNTITSFKTLTELGVDYIGSDSLLLLANYFKKR